MASTEPPPYPLLYLTELQRVWDGFVERQRQIRKPLNLEDQNAWSIQELRRILGQVASSPSNTLTKPELIQQILQQASRSNNYFIDDGCSPFVYGDDLKAEYRNVLARPLRTIENKAGNIPLDRKCDRNEPELFDRWKTRILANRIRQTSTLPGAPLMAGMYYPAARVQDMPEFRGVIREGQGCEEWKRQQLPSLLAEAQLRGRQQGIADSVAPVEDERKRIQREYDAQFQLLNRDRKQLEDEKQRRAEEAETAMTVPIARLQLCENQLAQLKEREAQVNAAYSRLSSLDAERRRLQDQNEQLTSRSARDQKDAATTIKRLREENERLARLATLNQADVKAFHLCQRENQGLKTQMRTLQQCQSERLRFQNDSDEYKRGQEACTNDLNSSRAESKENKERVTSLQSQVNILQQGTQLLQSQLQRSSDQQREMEAELKLLRASPPTVIPRITPPVTRSRTASTTAQFAQVESAYEDLQRRTDALTDVNRQLEEKLKQITVQHQQGQAELQATITDLQMQLADERKRVSARSAEQKGVSPTQYNALEGQYEEAKAKLMEQASQTELLRNTLEQFGPALQSLIQELKDYYSITHPAAEAKPEKIEEIESILRDHTSSPNELFSRFLELII